MLPHNFMYFQNIFPAAVVDCPSSVHSIINVLLVLTFTRRNNSATVDTSVNRLHRYQVKIDWIFWALKEATVANNIPRQVSWYDGVGEGPHNFLNFLYWIIGSPPPLRRKIQTFTKVSRLQSVCLAWQWLEREGGLWNILFCVLNSMMLASVLFFDSLTKW